MYVVGYPAWDGRRNEPEPMRRIFADIYNVKRLQPGEIRNPEVREGIRSRLFDPRRELRFLCGGLGERQGAGCTSPVPIARVTVPLLSEAAPRPLLKRAGVQFG